MPHHSADGAIGSCGGVATPSRVVVEAILLPADSSGEYFAGTESLQRQLLTWFVVSSSSFQWAENILVMRTRASRNSVGIQFSLRFNMNRTISGKYHAAWPRLLGLRLY
jgi:hypothetical protein